MKRLDDRLSLVAHIKRHTKGTSNEISFSVLDAAKIGLDKETEKEAKGTSRLKHVQVSPAHVGRVLAVVLLSCLAVFLLAVGGWFIYQEYQGQKTSIQKLDQALSLLAEADDTILMMDEALIDPLSKESAALREKVFASKDDTQSLLEQADEKARAASVDLKTSAKKEVANETVSTISARMTLLDSGIDLLMAWKDGADAMKRAENLWKDVLEADSLARKAAVAVSDGSANNISASKKQTSNALELLKSANSELDKLQKDYSYIDLSALSAYVDKRIAALSCALASDNAMLAKDLKEAQKQNDAYNKADAEAAALAKKLPDDVVGMVKSSCEESVKALQETYEAARLQAGTADAIIRDYLGSGTK